MEKVTLTGRTKKGKQRVRDFGPTWCVTAVVDGEKFASQHFRLRKGQNMCGDRTIWMDLNGSSYVPAATDRRSATAMVRQLRLAADWLDMQKTHAFRK